MFNNLLNIVIVALFIILFLIFAVSLVKGAYIVNGDFFSGAIRFLLMTTLVVVVFKVGIMLTDGKTLAHNTTDVTVTVVDKETTSSSYYINNNNMPIFIHNNYYKVTIDDSGKQTTISTEEYQYNKLSAGDKVDMIKEDVYLFGKYFYTNYHFKY